MSFFVCDIAAVCFSGSCLNLDVLIIAIKKRSADGVSLGE